MKHTDTPLTFISARIQEAHTALCTFEHPSFFVKTHLINASKVDEEGNIWFRIAQSASAIAKELETFPISLMFYKKQIGYYVNVEALATVCKNEGVFMVKAQIINASYSEIYNYNEKYSLNSWQSISKLVTQFWQSHSLHQMYKLHSGN
jgi:hypothetical protein